MNRLGKLNSEKIFKPSGPATDILSSGKSAIIRAQARIVIFVSLFVFACEAIVMVILFFLPELPEWIKIFIDSSLLILLLAPVLYFFVFRPLVQRVLARQRAEEELRHNQEHLEELVTDRTSEISALLDGARAVLSYQDFHTAAESIYIHCKKLIGAGAGYVALKSKAGTENDVQFLDSGGAPCSADPSLPLPIRGLQAQAYRESKVVYHNDFPNSEWIELMPDGHTRLENVILAPLIINNQTVGLMGLANKPGGFDDHDARLASAFSQLASVALLNSRTMESLEASEKRLRSVVETAVDAIISVDGGGRIIFWNRAAEVMFGYTAEEAINQSVTFIMPRKFHKDHKNALAAAVTSGTIKHSGAIHEMSGVRKDGLEFPLELSLANWKTKDGIFFTAIVRDVSARVTAEEALRKSEQSLRRTFDQSPIGAAITSLDYRFQQVNHELCRITGYSQEELLGLGLAEIAHASDLEEIFKEVQLLVSGKIDHCRLDKRFIRKDGSIVFIRLSVRLMADTSGIPMYLLPMMEDVTDKRLAQKQIEASLKEKEVLLQEIHHRVKNNMQVISSLLNLQAAKINEAGLKDMFQESQNRVQAMALIHETLYQFGNLSSISMKKYISDLANSLFRMYGTTRPRIGLRVNVENINLTIDQTVPCALVINELISNSLKYAFPDGRSGEIGIDLYRTANGEVRLTVSDNGIGVAEDLDIRGTETLGLQLVTGLVEDQLGGAVEMSSQNGTRFSICFTQNGYPHRI